MVKVSRRGPRRAPALNAPLSPRSGTCEPSILSGLVFFFIMQCKIMAMER